MTRSASPRLVSLSPESLLRSLGRSVCNCFGLKLGGSNLPVKNEGRTPQSRFWVQSFIHGRTSLQVVPLSEDQQCLKRCLKDGAVGIQSLTQLAQSKLWSDACGTALSFSFAVTRTVQLLYGPLRTRKVLVGLGKEPAG